MSNYSNTKNLVCQSTIIANNVHIGNIYNVNGIRCSIPLELNTLPFIAESEVIGRANDLEKVYRLFNTSDKVFLVNGLGGIGKTTFAKYFVAHFRQQFNHIAWINVSSGIKEAFVSNTALLDNLHLKEEFSDIKEAFVSNMELLDNLHLREELVRLPKNEQWVDTAFSLIINRMRQLEGVEKQQKNILILDDVGEDIEDTRILDQIALRPNWKVLVTSREKLLGFHEYELGLLTLEDAKVLFYLHYQREQDDVLVEEILGLIQKHTLTIELLARSIHNNPRLNLK